jgi:CheY-like chemotaxis protein
LYEKALVVAKNEAEHYSQMQETFLANMSHEIRTPMNAIAGFTEQVLQTELKQQQQSYLQIVQRSIQHLLVIINDILDYSKLKADKLTVEHIPFNLQQIIQESVMLMSEIAAQKNIEVKNRVGQELQQPVMGDPVRMKQVLLNLIGNAIKFTDKGSVTITHHVVEESPMRMLVELRVIDTGIGISPENVARIFDAFEQAEVSTTRKYGGSGLGLSITRKLVSLMNGTIRLESQEGEGTSVILQFSFELATDTQQMADETETDLYKALEEKEVLIADDEEWNTALLATILSKYNVRYTIVKNGKEAVDYITRHHVDLVLMDVRMPVLNGFEATMAIRQLPQPKNAVPVIALTAATGQQQLQQCYEAGMNAVLGKPYSEQQFFKVVARALSHAVVPVNTEPEAEMATKAPPQTQSSFSLALLEQMSNGDNAFFNKMLRIFIDSTKDALAKIKEGIANKDFDTIEDYAHKLAPPCRHLEAAFLLQTLKQIEAKAKQKTIDGMDDLHAAAVKEYKAIAAEMKKLLNT